jgi:CRP-like cAMP-binding protein
VPGSAARLKSAQFAQELDHNGEFTGVLRRYAEALITQLAQTAACNAVHRVEQRCARWLLQTHDRMGGGHFTLTQEFLGGMLGVRRTGVSEACSRLQQQKLIRYSRGLIEIVDRKGLERLSCECHRATQKDFARLLGRTSRRNRTSS